METKLGLGKDSWRLGARRLVIMVIVLSGIVAGIFAGVLLPEFEIPDHSTLLQWLVALLPGGIIVSQLVYLLSSRRKQYREALGPLEAGEVSRLEDLYFGLVPLTFRYLVPAILVTILCATIISALVNPHSSLPWLYGEAAVSTGPKLTPGAPPDTAPGAAAAVKGPADAGTPGATGTSGPQGATSTPSGSPGGRPPADTAKGGTQSNMSEQSGARSTNPLPTGPSNGTGPSDASKTDTKPSTSSNSDFWPKEGPTRQTLRGAALGFLGAYVYLLLMLTDRARQRDITTGIATWAAAMPVLGLLMGGVAGLIIASALGATDTSWTRDAIFFVAGMLPRQFAGFVQSGVVKMFQQGSSPTFRTVPLTTLRGVGRDVASRLEEEGIHDVSALAFASPHQLIRVTTYSPRQIVDWIDEALLVTTVPEHWDALEKTGVTGASDLAWYQDHQDSIPALAAQIKLDAALLSCIVTRLSQDAQVEDLRQLYWDRAESLLKYRFLPNFSPDVKAGLTAEIKAIMGVHSVTVDGERLTIHVDRAQREVIDKQLRGNSGIEPQS
jgi:hypothetical protein